MNLMQQLKFEEGWSPTVYQDTASLWTIGCGRLVDRRGGGITEDEIQYLLQNDIREKTAQVMAAFPWVAQLNDARQAVLIGMCFQMGIGGLRGFAQMLAAAQRGDFVGAATEMRSSTWATQTPARAERLAKQMQTGNWSTYP